VDIVRVLDRDYLLDKKMSEDIGHSDHNAFLCVN